MCVLVSVVDFDCFTALAKSHKYKLYIYSFLHVLKLLVIYNLFIADNVLATVRELSQSKALDFPETSDIGVFFDFFGTL